MKSGKPRRAVSSLEGLETRAKASSVTLIDGNINTIGTDGADAALRRDLVFIGTDSMTDALRPDLGRLFDRPETGPGGDAPSEEAPIKPDSPGDKQFIEG
jgi:hypothetical protein